MAKNGGGMMGWKISKHIKDFLPDFNEEWARDLENKINTEGDTPLGEFLCNVLAAAKEKWEVE